MGFLNYTNKKGIQPACASGSPPGRNHHHSAVKSQQSVQPPAGAFVSSDQVFRRQATACPEDKTEKVGAQVGILSFRAQQCEQSESSSDGHRPKLLRMVLLAHQVYCGESADGSEYQGKSAE